MSRRPAGSPSAASDNSDEPASAIAPPSGPSPLAALFSGVLEAVRRPRVAAETLAIAERSPAEHLLSFTFWRDHAPLAAWITAGVLLNLAFLNMTLPNSSEEGTSTPVYVRYGVLLVYLLAPVAVFRAARAVADYATNQAIVEWIVHKASGRLDQLDSPGAARPALDELEAICLPPREPAPNQRIPAMRRLFQRICKEASQRRFESGVVVVQPFREEAVLELVELEALQKLALRMGILGTFIGLLFAVSRIRPLIEAVQGSSSAPMEEFSRFATGLATDLRVAFGGSVAGLTVAVSVALLAGYARKRLSDYFRAMDDAVTGMLALAAAAESKSPHLLQLEQASTAMHQLRDSLDSHGSHVKSLANRVEAQTSSIEAGIGRLALAKANLESFTTDLRARQDDFLARVRSEYQVESIRSMLSTSEAQARSREEKISAGVVALSAELAGLGQTVASSGEAQQAAIRSIEPRVDAVLERMEDLAPPPPPAPLPHARLSLLLVLLGVGLLVGLAGMIGR